MQPPIFTKLFALITVLLLWTTSVMALPPLDAVEDPLEIMSLNARSPLAPEINLCGACCSACGSYYCCGRAACSDLCMQCCRTHH
ncbi:Ecp38 [Fulvia fulva]|uniref:Ecp38 n=1 Tax=Passalora fulva TaxID=5499 RepID=A0A1P8YXK8_PASFU|nr:Ecp38 [Fulvia fulva]AQA29244.1 extracellular protein 38 [Fulvia fulva]KAK4610715.1 Ecp38 [Fulvia fulva]KAK4611029.1 Ecp38 [Fulvia fulva]UJO24738.1 Ecp38 [Fulvia fulva]WPV21991.1 Ecp38 [Fulvia fulva]